MFKQWKAWFKNKMKTRDVAEFDWSMDMVLIWAKYLTQKSIGQREFQLAKQRSLDLDWMPSNAKEFLALVRFSGISDFPEIRKAYNDGANNKYEHEVVYETCRRIGFMAMHEGVERETYPQWREVYPQVCEEYRQGARFTIPETNRIEQKHIPASADVANDFLKNLRKQLVGAA